MIASSSSTSSSSASNQWSQLSFVEVLEDLSSRFIVNLPSEELQRIERICFQVEQAHWFYEDFLRPLNPKLPSLNLRKFSIYILQTASLSVPVIRQYVSSDNDANSSGTIQDLQALGGQTYGLEAAFDEFMKYKTRVPVCGVVLLSEDFKSCILVKGWKSNAAWGFPKGKINQSETHRDCAVRETLEETGFDCSQLLSPDSPHWMELNVREQKMRLYIVPGVPKDTIFETQTRKEISKISWFKLSDLPTWKQSQAAGGGGLASANAGAKFYLVTPFIGKLKQWIRDNRTRVQIEQGSAPGPSSEQGLSIPPTEPAAMRTNFTQPTMPSFGEDLDSRRRQLQTSDSRNDNGGNSYTSGHLSSARPNSDSATLLAMLQGSNAKPAPPPGPPINNLFQPQNSVSLTASSSMDQSYPSKSPLMGHYRQPSDAEQTLIQHFQNHKISPSTSQSPLPAPRATKSSSSTLKLLEMLSPGTPVGMLPREKELVTTHVVTQVDTEETERVKKREALLKQLMGNEGEVLSFEKSSESTSLPRPYGITHSPTSPSTREVPFSAMSKRAPQTQDSSAQPEPHIASPPSGSMAPFSAANNALDQHLHGSQHHLNHPSFRYAYPRTDSTEPAQLLGSGRDSLLAMLNAGPMAAEQSNGNQANVNHMVQGHDQSMPYQPQLAMFPLPIGPGAPSHHPLGPLPPHLAHLAHHPHFHAGLLPQSGLPHHPAYLPSHLGYPQGYQAPMYIREQQPAGAAPPSHPLGLSPLNGFPPRPLPMQHGVFADGPTMRPDMPVASGESPHSAKGNGNTGGLLALLNGPGR